MQFRHLITLVLGLGLGALQAQAAGFRCQAEADDLRIDIYHHTDPEVGTRRAAVMILSNPSLDYGQRTIAVFRDEEGSLENEGTQYEATVEIPMSEQGLTPRVLEDIYLADLRTVQVEIDFDYEQPVAHGDAVEGHLLLIHANGEQSQRELACTRYLKSESGESLELTEL